MEILIPLLFGALILFLAIYQYYKNEERRAELRTLAQRHGWQFMADRDDGMDVRYSAFACLQQGSNQYAYNILSGTADRREICGFDYHYETYSTDSKGNTQTHHHHFSAVIVDVALPLKPLLIRPEGFFDKVAELFGADDIDFESDEFSRSFYVKAEDRRWAFDVIHQATIEFLLAAPRFTIQFAGSRVIAYRGQLFDPDDFDTAVQVIAGIIDRLPEYLLREWKGAVQ